MTKPTVAINGFGRMGRLAMRQFLEQNGKAQDFEVVLINEAAGDVQTAAHLLQFDSVHGRLDQLCLLYTSPSPRDLSTARMPSSA